MKVDMALRGLYFNRNSGLNSPPLAANDSNDLGFNTPLLAAG